MPIRVLSVDLDGLHGRVRLEIDDGAPETWGVSLFDSGEIRGINFETEQTERLIAQGPAISKALIKVVVDISKGKAASFPIDLR